MGVCILDHKVRCLSGGQGWVDACCEMGCKKLCMLEGQVCAYDYRRV